MTERDFAEAVVEGLAGWKETVFICSAWLTDEKPRHNAGCGSPLYVTPDRDRLVCRQCGMDYSRWVSVDRDGDLHFDV